MPGGVVEIDGPGGGADGVFEVSAAADFILDEDVIAHEAAGFAFTGDVGHPVELEFRVGGEFFGIGEIAVDGTQQVVTNGLGVVDGVEVHAVFPEPFAAGIGAGAGDVHGPRHAGKCVVRGSGFGFPHEGIAHGHGACGGRGAGFAELGGGLGAHAVAGTRPVADPTVAGAVDEKPRLQADAVTGERVAGIDVGDAFVGGVRAGVLGAPGHEQGDVRLGGNPGEAVGIG